MNVLATIVQVLCLILVTLGIAIELEYEADLGFLLITLGSILFAISTKIRKSILEKELNEYKHLNEKKNEK